MEEIFGGDDDDEDDADSHNNNNNNNHHEDAASRSLASYCKFIRNVDLNFTITESLLPIDLPQKTQINEVTNFAVMAIETFTDKHLTKCGNLTDIPCRFQSMVDEIDSKYPYER